MRTLIICYILIFPICCFAQEVENWENWIDPTEELRNELSSKMREQNVSDFFITTNIYINADYIAPIDNELNCKDGFSYNAFVFWKKEDNYKLKKYDNCGEFKALDILDKRPIDLYTKNINKIKVEKVKPYTTGFEITKEGDTLSIIQIVSHSSQQNFWFYDGNEYIKNVFDLYDITTDSNNENINFEYNNNLSIVKLNNICREIIIDFETNNKFIRIKN
jgi:hypothetical protein